MIVRSTSKEKTEKTAREIAKKIIRKKTNKGVIIGLRGDLGAGKTTFVKGFAKEFNIKNRILSPTFVIMRIYHSISKDNGFNLYHLDAYRIEKQRELNNIGLKKIIKEPKNIILIEWIEKIKSFLPKNLIIISFKHGKNKNERIIKFKNL